jgi:tRNA(Ile)-lysidine synthase
VGPHPAVAAVRQAVRASLAGLAPGDLVLVACSGGADSLALAAAVSFEARRAEMRAGGVVVDHGLQAGSAEVACRVAATMAGLGLEPARCAAVTVGRPDGPGPYPGPEAAARSARYAALADAAHAAGANAIMLGHTLDDQAETVLLGLARGSGARSLAGMAAVSGLYRRPLLGVRRAETTAACAALGLQPWDDPQNADPAFARVRVRRDLLPALTEALGPGVPEALARTAGLLRADADALDELAAEAAHQIRSAAAEAEAGAGADAEVEGAAGWPVAALAALPAAIRHRILRAAALAAGCPGGALSQRHVAALDELVTGWHGQRWADLPGGVRGQRRYGRLLFTAAVRSEDPGGRE